ncbi:MAG: phosphate ABC transporter permease PstA [bacterium]
MNARRIEETVARILMYAATFSVLCCLVLIVGTVLVRGLPALTLDMITHTPEGGYYIGRGGGVLNAILGSLFLTAGATVIAIVISLPVALYINVYARRGSRLASLARLALDVLWGVPSIVYGAFGFLLMMAFGMRASMLGGMITVAVLVFPVMARGMDEVIRMVPHELMEASYALGATRFETAFKVVVRQALPGILSAVLIAFGRGIGDAASVLFTAGFTDSLPFSLLEPAATLPLAIFFQLGSPLPEVQARAYASALILTGLILVISLAVRFLTRRYSRQTIS